MYFIDEIMAVESAIRRSRAARSPFSLVAAEIDKSVSARGAYASGRK